MIQLLKATELGDFIRRVREQAEVSRAEMASTAGISEATMGDIETGRIARPPDNRLRAIARVLRVSFQHLLGLIPAELRSAVEKAERDVVAALKAHEDAQKKLATVVNKVCEFSKDLKKDGRWPKDLAAIADDPDPQ